MRHPICAICLREPASVLDHVIPHRGDARLFWDQRNWQAACIPCHNAKSRRERDLPAAPPYARRQ